MKRGIFSSLSAIFLFLGVSCASLPPICVPKNAREAGVAQALRGENLQPGKDETCPPDRRADLRRHFEEGYREGRAHYCDAAASEKRGFAKGAAGEAANFPNEVFNICENVPALTAAFQRGYGSGVNDFCKEDRAASDGLEAGSRGGDKTFPPRYKVCTPVKIARLKSVFAKQYREGIAKFCRAETIGEDGLRDGRAGREPLLVEQYFAACSEVEKKKISRRYFEDYNSALLQLCSPSNMESAARENAATSAVVHFPEAYAICFERFPEQRGQFEVTFREERQQIVATRCTFLGGSQDGSRDANAGNDKKADLPTFCNETLYHGYLQGYLDGWKNTKVRLCDPGAAYAKGLQRAQTSTLPQESYVPPALCSGEFSTLMTQKFNEGFQYGRGL